MTGCQFANDKTYFFGQERNALETFLAYEKANDGLNHYTELCGFTSLWNGYGAKHGKDLRMKVQGANIRPPDYMFAFANNPENFELFQPWNGCIVGTVPTHQVQGWFPQILQTCFDVDSALHEGLSFDDVVQILASGNPVQLARKVGHFVVAVDYDDVNDLLIYWDSFHLFINSDGSLTDDGTGGFRRTLTQADFSTDLNSRFIEILG